MQERWLSVTEAARYAQRRYAEHGKTISRKTVSRWIQRGWVVAERRDSRWYVEPQSLRKRVQLELAKLGISVPISEPPVPQSDRLRRLRAVVEAMNAEFLQRLEAGLD